MANLRKEPPYRWEAFRHWANLAALSFGVAAGALHDPLWWVATAGVQAGVLWVLPDIPTFKAWVHEKHRATQLYQERVYYIRELWGLREAPEDERGWFARMFLEAPQEDVDAYIRDQRDPACRDYLEMREIVVKLNELRSVPGVTLSQHDIDRLDVVINGYLRLIFACRSLERAIDKMDPRSLEHQFETIRESLPNAEPSVRAALNERLRIVQSQLERRPKLEAMLLLYRSRATDMVHQLRNIQSQVLANPSTDVHGMLDQMATQQEMMADPAGGLDTDRLIRDLLSESPKPPPETKPKAAAAQRKRQPGG